MVIQRWQSALLFIAAILLGVSVFCPIAETITPKGLLLITGLDSWLAITMSVLCTILTMVSIFKYNNLKNQIKTVGISILLSVAYLLTSYLSIATVYSDVNYKLGGIFVIGSIILQIIAIFCIKSDENKLKSYDRIR